VTAAKPNWPTSFQRPARPSLDFSMTFFQSSTKPISAYPLNTTRAIQTVGWSRRAHSSVDRVMATTMTTPPMVGVPTFASMWVCGPSSRMICSIFLRFIQPMNHGYMR
jgi:hypothetical protein